MVSSIFVFSDVDKIEFLQKNFVLTGFDAFDEKRITKKILDRGGIVRSSLVLKTDYLVVNEYFDHQSVKYKRAVELNGAGKNIVIISKAQFDKFTPNEIRRLSVIPTGSGNLEFDKVSFAMLAITVEEEAKLTEIIEAKGGVVDKLNEKTQYLICNPKEAETRVFWSKVIEMEKQASIYLMTPELFYLWTNEEYQLGKTKFNKKIEIILHYLKHTEDWMPDQYGRIVEVEELMLSKACRIIDLLSEEKNDFDNLQLYLDWGHNVEKGKWFGKIKPEKMTIKGNIAIIDDYLTETESWGRVKKTVRDGIDKYIGDNCIYLLKTFFDKKKNDIMCSIFNILSEKEKTWKENDYSDGFYVYSLVNKYTEKAIEESEIDMVKYLMDYKATHFDENFVEKAASNELDIELGLKRRKAVYYVRGTELVLGEYDGKPIEWMVLKKEENKALLISKYALLKREYTNVNGTKITWENCTLRRWLNEDFYIDNFSEEEKSKILSVRNINSGDKFFGESGGNNTDDKIFLLSIDEVLELRKYIDIECTMRDGSSICNWWLRATSDSPNGYVRVYYDGPGNEWGDIYVSNGHEAVRPALWVDLSNL